MKRKVRKDFDKHKGYSVDVSECTEEEKKEVQQAFFDAGIPWQVHGEVYKYIDAVKYTNTTYGFHVITAYLMHGSTTVGCNMTAKEFLDLVYEPEQVGHVHAELMAQYAEDAKTHAEPWKLWQILVNFTDGTKWTNLNSAFFFHPKCEYRRKPKTHFVHGVEIPDLRVSPEHGKYYYLADPTESEFTYRYMFHGDSQDILWVERGLAYQPTEEGRQASILHTKAMLWGGI